MKTKLLAKVLKKKKSSLAVILSVWTEVVF